MSAWFLLSCLAALSALVAVFGAGWLLGASTTERWWLDNQHRKKYQHRR
jgi:hypothetical protein